MLDEKRRALLAERTRLVPLLTAARAEWERSAMEADVWRDRAAVLSGARRLRLAQQYRGAPASVVVPWRGVLGVRVPEEPQVVPGDAGESLRIGGSAALAAARDSHAAALHSAARFAALQLALDRIGAELDGTTRRLRAIEHRWIPAHERALESLDLALDESEREDAARTRWASAADGRDGLIGPADAQTSRAG